ncbi:MAG TPA: hypothetical protein VHW23_23875 [Kofleriaceae bacterium]|jgi:hypothetical protein|nr:hypothetical protein [Kofleriaceae bacterium]
MRSIPARQFSIPDCQCDDRFTPSVDLVTRERDIPLARAPTPGDLLHLGTHRHRARRVDDRSLDVKLVSVNTGVCAHDASCR